MRELTFIICSVLGREVQTFLSLDYPHAESIYLNSVLHIYPQKLHKNIEAALETRENQYCVLIYGDCNAHIKAISQRPNCERTWAVNCGELLLGPELYKSYRNEKAFLFLPEWTERWREIFQQELGFSDPVLAQEFMQENQRRLVYLDTGLVSVPWNHLKDISEFFNMPTEVVSVSFEHLRQTVKSAVQRLEAKNHP
jgi:hypothetical protein